MEGVRVIAEGGVGERERWGRRWEREKRERERGLFFLLNTAMPQSKKSRRAKVSFSYAADNIDELSLEPGQVVEVIAEEEEGWWRGKLGGKEGVFPSNFVEIIEEAAEPAKPAVTNQAPPPQQSAPPNRPPSPVESKWCSHICIQLHVRTLCGKLSVTITLSIEDCVHMLPLPWKLVG